MTVHSDRKARDASLPGPLASFRSCGSGSWKILARPGHLEVARSFLGPLPVESLLAALKPEAPVEEGQDTGGTRAGASATGRAGRPPGGRGATLELDCGAGVALLVKALRRGGLPARLRGGYHGTSRLLAEMAILEEASARGIPTARLAFGATGRRPGGNEVTLLATELVPDAASLGELLAGRGPAPAGTDPPPGRRRKDRSPGGSGDASRASRRGALRSAGAAVGRAHELGLDHADLNIGNVLVQDRGGEWSGCVIDLGLSTLGPPLEVRRRAANLVRLIRSVEKHLGRRPGDVRDAAAFLQGYLGALPQPRRPRRRDLLRAIRQALPSLLAHRLGWRLLGRR